MYHHKTSTLAARSAAALLAALVALPAAAAPAAPATPPATRPANPSNAAADAQRLIDKGLAFLKTQQKPDGSWQADREPPAFTALSLRSFVREPAYTPDTPFVKKGYDKLLSTQLNNGGIYSDLLANYNTAIAVSALAAANKEAGDGRYDAPIAKAVAYLKGLQWDEQMVLQYNDANKGKKLVSGPDDPFYGGFGYGGANEGEGRPDLSNLQVTLEALHDAGVPPTDPAFKRAVAFVTKLQNRSESNPSKWAENDGGFIYSPAQDKTGESKAGAYVDPDGDRRLRSYGSMTYAGLKSMIYAGLTKEDPRVAAAWDWINRNWTLTENPGMKLGDPAQATSGLFYYYLTLGRTLNTYGQPILTDDDGTKHDWRMDLIAQLKKSQSPDGSWTGSKRWFEGNPVLVTNYAVQALQEARESLKEKPAAR